MRSSQAWFAKIKQLAREGRLLLDGNGGLLIHYNPREEGFTQTLVCYCKASVKCSCYFIAHAYVAHWLRENEFALEMELDSVDPQRKIWEFSARY